MRIHKARAIVAALVVLAAGIVPLSLLAQDESPAVEEPIARDPLEVYSDLALFGEIFDRVRAEYVDVPDERELIRAAIQGMLTSLDPHSGYLSPGSRPARAAGVSSMGVTTLTMPSSMVTSIPRPPNSPDVSWRTS